DIGIVRSKRALHLDSVFHEYARLDRVCGFDLADVVREVRNGIRIVVGQPGESCKLCRLVRRHTAEAEIRDQTRWIGFRIKQRNINFRNRTIIGAAFWWSVSGDSILRFAELEFVRQRGTDNGCQVSDDRPPKGWRIKRSQAEAIATVSPSVWPDLGLVGAN